MEKFSHIDKVSGAVSSDVVEEQLRINREETLKEMKDFEIPETIEETQTIDNVIFGLEIIFKYVYKLECKPVLREKIHIVQQGTLLEKYGRGMFRSPDGDIYVESLSSFHDSKILFAKVLAHELIHYLSFNSIKVSEHDGKIDIGPHIVGLSILNKEKETESLKSYFDTVDEALTMYISKTFMDLELARAAKEDKDRMTTYGNEWRAVNFVREWLHNLPDSTGIDRKKWDPYYIVSIPYAEIMAEVIQSGIDPEEKIKFYKEKIESIPRETVQDFYLERTTELDRLTDEIKKMIEAETHDPNEAIEKGRQLINDLIRLKLTGQGFLATVRFIEERLGRGSFKKLAEKFSKVILRQ